MLVDNSANIMAVTKSVSVDEHVRAYLVGVNVAKIAPIPFRSHAKQRHTYIIQYIGILCWLCAQLVGA
jgi:hypothetical protein